MLDDVWLSLEIINEILKKRSLRQLTIEQYREVFDFPIRDYYFRLGFNFAEEPFEVLADEYIIEYERRCRECSLIRNAVNVLKEVTAAGVTQSILSASHEQSLRSFVSFFNIADFFANMIGLDNHYANSKIENGKRWIKELQINPKDVLLVGDTVHDFQVAQEIGTDCLLVSWGHHHKVRLQKCGVDIIHSLDEVIAKAC